MVFEYASQPENHDVMVPGQGYEQVKGISAFQFYPVLDAGSGAGGLKCGDAFLYFLLGNMWGVLLCQPPPENIREFRWG